MKKIWNDPVWSKVIAGAILAVLGVLLTGAYKYFSLSVGERSYQNINFGDTLAVNQFFIITLVLFLVGILIWVLFVSKYKKYDIFFSAPMSFETNEEYQSVKKECMELIESLKENTKYKKIYYAAENIESMDGFSAAKHAVLDDLKALRKSKRFLLYMPKKIPTSAVFEAGYALRKNLPTAYFCKSSEDLPFLMRDLNDSYRSVSKYKGQTIDQLCGYIKRCKNKIFAKSI